MKLGILTKFASLYGNKLLRTAKKEKPKWRKMRKSPHNYQQKNHSWRSKRKPTEI